MTGGERFYPDDTSQGIFRETVGMGYRVSQLKGYTNCGIAVATMLILDSIVYDLRHTMPLSVMVSDFAGVSDVCLSLPTVVGQAGVTRVLRPRLNDEEQAAFVRSAAAVKSAILRMCEF